MLQSDEGLKTSRLRRPQESFCGNTSSVFSVVNRERLHQWQAFVFDAFLSLTKFNHICVSVYAPVRNDPTVSCAEVAVSAFDPLISDNEAQCR